jgi:hypothetical protein
VERGLKAALDRAADSFFEQPMAQQLQAILQTMLDQDQLHR